MGCLGVHFALSRPDAKRVRAASGDDETLLELITGDIEERYLEAEGPWQFETDKAWDAIHRCLTDGTLAFGQGPFPLSYAILGGKPLYQGDDYIVAMVEPKDVSLTASALKSVTKAWLRERYLRLDPEDYGPEHGDEDFEYVWSNFEGLPEFFERASAAGRPVIFTADQ